MTYQMKLSITFMLNNNLDCYTMLLFVIDLLQFNILSLYTIYCKMNAFGKIWEKYAAIKLKLTENFPLCIAIAPFIILLHFKPRKQDL